MCFLLAVTVTLTSQVSHCVEKMNSPATPDGASPCASAATARTNVATAATRRPATTAPPSPAGRQTSACPKSSCVTDGLTAGTGGTSLGSCAVRRGRTCSHVNRPSFGAGAVSAFLTPGGVTTRRTAPMAAMKSTAVSSQPCKHLLCHAPRHVTATGGKSWLP